MLLLLALSVGVGVLESADLLETPEVAELMGAAEVSAPPSESPLSLESVASIVPLPLSLSPSLLFDVVLVEPLSFEFSSPLSVELAGLAVLSTKESDNVDV